MLGADHPNTNHARLNFARLLVADGKASEALLWIDATLAAREKALGENHPWTKDAASITADAFDTPGRVEEAVRLCALYQSER